MHLRFYQGTVILEFKHINITITKIMVISKHDREVRRFFFKFWIRGKNVEAAESQSFHAFYLKIIGEI